MHASLLYQPRWALDSESRAQHVRRRADEAFTFIRFVQRLRVRRRLQTLSGFVRVDTLCARIRASRIKVSLTELASASAWASASGWASASAWASAWASQLRNRLGSVKWPDTYSTCHHR
jgi:hypothetical protein